jgi:hypothetical protein
VRYKEDLSNTGQNIQTYTLEVKTGGITSTSNDGSEGEEEGEGEGEGDSKSGGEGGEGGEGEGWKVVEAAAGWTIGPHLLDLIPTITGSFSHCANVSSFCQRHDWVTRRVEY